MSAVATPVSAGARVRKTNPVPLCPRRLVLRHFEAMCQDDRVHRLVIPTAAPIRFGRPHDEAAGRNLAPSRTTIRHYLVVLAAERGVPDQDLRRSRGYPSFAPRARHRAEREDQ